MSWSEWEVGRDGGRRLPTGSSSCMRLLGNLPSQVRNQDSLPKATMKPSSRAEQAGPSTLFLLSPFRVTSLVSGAGTGWAFPQCSPQAPRACTFQPR